MPRSNKHKISKRNAAARVQRRAKRPAKAGHGRHARSFVRARYDHQHSHHEVRNMHNRAGRPGGAAIEAAQKKVAGAQQRTRANINIMPPDVVKKEIERLLANGNATEYLKKNVSKTAVEVISMLATPRTDEYLAEQLGMKINAVRRILNIMQGYGITNYYVSKNTKGWLSFAWYVNISKLDPFLERVSSVEKETIVVGEECNDYFICNNCYKNDKLVHTFDSAFELGFKCACGKSLSRMDRLDAEALINGEVNG